MANTFKKVIDMLMWRQVPPAPNAHAAGSCLCSDLRSGLSRNPFVYQLSSATVLNRFNIVTKAWNFVQSPALAGTFGAGAAAVFAPSLGLVGTIAAGATTSSVVISTAFPQAVGLNMLANRGGSGEYGFKLRIIDSVAGKTEERYIVANTASTTPTIRVLSPFTFTPATGARYEIVAGRVFMLSSGTMAANAFRSIEVGTNFLSTTLPITNLPATITTDTSLVCLDEQYTPYDMLPGEGMIEGTFVYDTGVETRHALAASVAGGASTLTGQATLGDSTIAANEYRNFQIRIVQDTTTPTAVGQRRIIASHTAGPSPVYTVGTSWTVAPSINAKYVIEYPNLILARTTANTTTYAYNYGDATVNNSTASITANTWSATYFSTAAPAANAVGCGWIPSFGIEPDSGRNARHSVLYFFRGNSATVDTLDIAAAIGGTWTGGVVIDGAVTVATGTSYAYSPFGQEGRFCYINAYTASAINQIFRFDVLNRVLTPFTPTDFLQSGTAALGNRMAAYCANDVKETGTDQYDVILLNAHLSVISQELIPLV
jgi:hypothetical protein